MSNSIETHVDEAEQRLRDSLDDNERSIRTDIRRMEQSISTEVQQHTQTITTSITASMNQEFAIFAQSSPTHMRQIKSTVTQAQGLLSEEIHMSHQSILKEFQELKCLLQLRTISNPPQDSTNLIPEPQSLVPARRHRQKRSAASSEISNMCTCNATTTESFFHSYTRKWFQKTSEKSLVHARDCPMWYMSQKKITANINIRVWRLLVSGSVVFEGGYYSWRGWNVSPARNLRCCITVPNGTGGFAVLQSLKTTLKKPRYRRDRQAAIEQCIADWHKLFSTGKASPDDVDEDGNNILHVSVP